MIFCAKRPVETQFGSPHTGMIYTAPQYSDHIGVSLLFNEKFDQYRSTLTLDTKDVDAKKSQPHKSQTSISSFFTSKTFTASSSKRKATTYGKAKTANVSSKKKKGTIMSHFAKKK